ncbi:MAG: hypothetical protein CSA62_13880 [Planctomycetota bacterium]|nr:MAG: hypothetical protein CSA62_13880 [Planctomycetota bacterium]
MPERPAAANKPAPLKLLPCAAASGAYNLALDEALLEDDGSWLRFYRWEPACLSLGYFQKHRDFADLPSGLDRVRRPTGGGAILHDKELTLSLALPDHALPEQVQKSYELLNKAMIAGIQATGIRIAEEGDGARAKNASPELLRWCFFRPTGLDLVDADGAKLFGSAQRRRGKRVLHHGSLMLGRSSLTPFTAALKAKPPIPELEARLSEAIAAALGLPLEPAGPLPSAILLRAEELRDNKYASSAWTKLR